MTQNPLAGGDRPHATSDAHLIRFRTNAVLRAALIAAALAATASAQSQIVDGTASPSDSATATSATTLPAVTIRDDGATGPSEQSPAFGARSTSTATRLDLSPRETPQSVSVVSDAQMEAFGLREVRDVLGNATGVQVERVETDRAYFLSRGFEVTNFQEDGVGMPFASGLLNGDMDMAVYDRVEILRGANGLMTSTGNPSATINFIRKRPTRELQASAGLTLGSWGLKRVDADVSGALNETGTVRGRLIVAGEDKASYLDRYRASKQVVSGIIEADLKPSTTLTVGHTQQNNRPKGLMWGALPLYDSEGQAIRYDVSASSAPSWTEWNTDDGRTFAELQHDLGQGWTVKGSLTHRRISSDTAMLYVYGTPDASTGSGLYSWPSTYAHEERIWMADIQVSGPFHLGGRQHQGVIGFNAARNTVHMASSYDNVGEALTMSQVLSGSFARPDFDQGVSAWGDRVDKRQSLFAAAQWNLSDPLRLVTGLNFTRAQSAGEQYGTPHNYDKSKAQPFVGLTAAVHPNWSVYGSVASIFNPQVELDASGQVLDPIEGMNTEAGLKFESSDRLLNASLAVFRTEQKNTAEYAGFENGQSVYRGVDATSTGFEIDVAGTLAPGWQLAAGYTRLSLTGEDGQDVRTWVPRQTFRISTTKSIPAVPGLDVGASVKWQSDIWRDQGSGVTSTQKAYALVDAMVRYAINNHWSVTANFNNLTNVKYLNSLYWDQNYYGAPRSVAVTLNWRL